MRNFYLFLLAISSFIALEACKPDPPVIPPGPPPPPPQPKTSMVINGDGFTNHKIVFDLTNENYAEHLVEPVDRTEFQMSGDSGNREFILVGSFDGNNTGTYSFPGTTFINFTHIDTATNETKAYDGTTGSIIVSSYNAVGAKVIGTFSGTLKNPATGAEIQATEGKFELTRRPDR